MDLHLLKACQTLTIQAVTEHRTASTDRRCKYLNGYVTVQHCSFGKPSFLDPWSSILASRNRRQSYFSPYMCLFNCHRQNKIIYANVYWNTINDSESQASPLGFFLREGEQALIDGANISTAMWLYNIVLLENLASWILDPWSLKLDPRISKLEAFELRDARIESCFLSFECQLTFERYFWARWRNEKWCDQHVMSTGQRKICVPRRNWTYDLPYTGRML